jgi:hypothetical protein
MTRKQEYEEFLKTDLWNGLRRECYRIGGLKCKECGAIGVRLDAHHVRYPARLEDTRQEDLECLCRGCHEKRHGRGEEIAITVCQWTKARLLEARQGGMITRQEFKSKKTEMIAAGKWNKKGAMKKRIKSSKKTKAKVKVKRNDWSWQQWSTKKIRGLRGYRERKKWVSYGNSSN